MIRKKTVICIFIIFFLIVMFRLNFSKEEYNDDLAKEIPWNQLSNNYKFNIIEFNSNTYNYGESIVNNDILDKLLIEKEIKTYSEESVEYKVNCKMYSLKEINENYIIVIQFEKENEYYLYVNYNYEINTLKDLMEATDFINNSNINTLSYNYFDMKSSKIKSKKLSQRKISKIKKDDLYSSIFNKNLNLPIEKSQQKIYNDYFKYEIVMEFNLSNLNKDILLEMTDSGYLIFSVFGIPYSFKIGEKDVLDFVDYFFK